jgi:very-short-patch-repair endonuclease
MEALLKGGRDSRSGRLITGMRKQRARSEVERRIAFVAGNQHGVITYEQLLAAGLSPPGITRRVQARRLHRIHPGVYAVGHAGLSQEGVWMAAVLACGHGAVLSHRSAAEHWGMLKPAGGVPHVSIPGRAGRRRRPGITIHRPSALLTSQTTSRANIPVTNPTRTLIDLRRANRGEFRRALRQAEYDRLPFDDLGQDGTRSELESMFQRLCRRHRLPTPEVNARLGPYHADFLFRAQRLVVETDSWRAHGGRVAYREDRERDLWLKLNHYEVVRFTYEQVRDEPARVAAALRELLRRRGWPPGTGAGGRG